MKSTTDDLEHQEKIIAGLLWYGTWFACALIAVGLLLTVIKPVVTSLALPLSGSEAMKAGVAVFILLPMARVGLMLTIFLRERDYTYTMIAALVLGIITAGIVAGIRA